MVESPPNGGLTKAGRIVAMWGRRAEMKKPLAFTKESKRPDSGKALIGYGF